jgi:hypothetical protein
MIGGDGAVKPMLEPVGGERSHLTGDLSSVVEQHEGWDTLHAEPAGEGRFLVGVHFDDAKGSCSVDGELFEYRCNSSARAAPGRPYVHENWHYRLFDHRVKVGGGDLEQPRQICVAFAAAGSSLGNDGSSIAGPAGRADDFVSGHSDLLHWCCGFGLPPNHVGNADLSPPLSP